MTDKQPASFDEWIKTNIPFVDPRNKYERCWQASSASLKQRLIEKMPEKKNTNMATSNAEANWMSGFNYSREEILKIIEEL